MRVLGIDYGHKRIGLAVSDESETLARELEIVSPKDFFARLTQIINEYEIGAIVLGWPLNMSGQPTQKTAEVGEFEAGIRKMTSVNIFHADERLTSSMAEGISGEKQNIDSLAAQILLQNYLNSKKV